MDFKKLITRYSQFGGIWLVSEYAKLGALWPAVNAGVRCLVKRQSFKGIYPEVLRCVEPFLVKKYTPVISCFRSQDSGNFKHEHPRVIWWCWLQGIESAPEIVKACYNSLSTLKVNGYEVNVIDNTNWMEYVDFPEFIVEKWEKGRIPAAMFSDLLRLELLIKYGGTWIDSTVLCTGGSKVDLSFDPAHARHTENKLSSALAQSQPSRIQELLDVPLFVFQYTKEGSVPVSISSWFISADSNNEVLIILREMLYAYWRDYDCVLDYYIFHLFFAMISKEYPEQIHAMPYAQSQRSLVLLHHWGEKFDQRKWDKLTSGVCFHKLAFRVSQNVIENKENYYNYILTEYGRI